ncbi:MAG: nitrous oxide reductase [Denitrovibrio sp.]|nr:MAG: nitrous oxide reductase [Denitrovibrio sp.]
MRFLLVIIMLFSITLVSDAEPFSKKPTGKPELIQSGPEKMWCPVCGMSLKMFYKTSHAVKLSGDKNKQYCSIRCLVQDYQGLKNIVKELLVVDVTSEKLIDARKAYYVLGSKAPGTMTKVSKFAFASKEDAKAFQAKMGGKIVSFTEAISSATDSMKKDVAMTDMKRAKMMYPKGKKIFSTACDKSIDPLQYNLINELKADISKTSKCGKLKEKELQAVALYLWDKVRVNTNSEKFLHVEKHEKCPVCGMFVYKYPKWAAEITYSQTGATKSVKFDGVKDMFKFYFTPEKWGEYKDIKITSIRVTDYYSNKAIEAIKAFYVLGSDVYGPMGKELIPFENMKYAETFMSDHNGQKILKFSDITKELTYKLDE